MRCALQHVGVHAAQKIELLSLVSNSRGRPFVAGVKVCSLVYSARIISQLESQPQSFSCDVKKSVSLSRP